MPSEEHFYTFTMPNGQEKEAFGCPACGVNQTAQEVREAGGCRQCDYQLEEEA